MIAARTGRHRGHSLNDRPNADTRLLLSNSMADLAESISKSVSAYTCARADAADHAMRAGALLCEAKEQCPHGQWLSFLTRAGIADRGAQRWMRLVHEHGVRHEPRHLLPIWMLSVLHDGERGRYDHYGEKPIPVAEAMQFIAAVGS
jgi:hypothetical protein